MLKKAQYKQSKYKKLFSVRETIHKNFRILRFKRPKWFFVKKNFRDFFFTKTYIKNRKQPFFYSQYGNSVSLDLVDLRYLYKKAHQSKNRIYLFYSMKTRVHALKKLYSQVKSMEDFIMFLEYRLDIVLWRAGFFASPAVARFYINHQNVKVNDTIVSLPYTILQKGDYVELIQDAKKESKNFLKSEFKPFTYRFPYKRPKKQKRIRLRGRFARSLFFPPFFMEVNWNTMSIVMLYEPRKESLKYLNYIYNVNLDIQSLKYYLKRL